MVERKPVLRTASRSVTRQTTSVAVTERRTRTHRSGLSTIWRPRLKLRPKLRLHVSWNKSWVGRAGKLLVVLGGRSTLLEQLAEPTFSASVKA